jgi:hypothetical protein
LLFEPQSSIKEGDFYTSYIMKMAFREMEKLKE